MKAPQQPDDLVAQFEKRWRRRRAAAVLSIAGIPAIMFLLPGSAALKGVLVGAVIAALAVFTLIDWRCPRCGVLLSRSFSLLGETCPNCGVVLNPHHSVQGMFRSLWRLLWRPPA